MKTVSERLSDWRRINGKSEAREMLDNYFYSYIFFNDSLGIRDYTEQELWCNENLGDENWCRFFNKFWFTNEELYVQFRITWYDEDTRKRNLL